MKLFVSCTALIHMLFDERVTEEDLDQGLFYLGCAREGVRPQMEESLGFKTDMACYIHLDNEEEKAKAVKEATYAANRVRETLLGALARAELEGRLLYRDKDSYNRYDELNELLEHNGLNPVEILERRPIHDHYSYPAVRKRMEVANPDVPVAWR